MTLSARNISWATGTTPVLAGISFEVKPHSFTGLLGPNGSGKTSLLNIVAGLTRPDHGTVTLNGDDIHRLPSRERAHRLALMEQQSTTNLELTVRQVVELGRIPHRGRWPASRGEGESVIEQSMTATATRQFSDRAWHTLSGGERQRVQLARALAQEPELLLLDEPTNHLDLGHQISLLSTVKELGMTTIVALHDLELAAAYCDHLVMIKDGSVIAAGTPENVLTSQLIHEVYGVSATIDTEPVTGRLRVNWHGSTL